MKICDVRMLPIIIIVSLMVFGSFGCSYVFMLDYTFCLLLLRAITSSLMFMSIFTLRIIENENMGCPWLNDTSV